MRIHVYSIMRNEEKILPYWLQHYSYANEIIVYDDNSDDSTKELLKKAWVEVRQYPKKLLDDGEMAKLYSKICAEDMEADWIICVDADEFVYPYKDFYHEYLDRFSGNHAIEAMGYEMKSPIWPNGNESIFEIRTGIPATWWENGGYKPCIVRGGTPVIFGCGRHNLNNRHSFKIHRSDEIKLLHYRDLGYEYYKWHHERNAARLAPDRKDKTWGKHNFKPMTREQFALSLLDSEWVI